MSSIIPKIALSSIGKRSTVNLSQDTSTTTNFGFIQPTFCREIVPNSHIEIKTSNLVRLEPLWVPTLSKMSLRHYHCFVPYNTLYFPFDAFYTGTNYTLPNGQTFIPSSVPQFANGEIWSLLSSHLVPTIASLTLFEDYLFSCRVYDEKNNLVPELSDSLAQDIADFFSDSFAYTIDVRSFIFYHTDNNKFFINGTSGARFNSCLFSGNDNIPSLGSCDSSFTILTSNGTFTVVANYGNFVKRLRKIFIGLGYPFTPYLEKNFNFLKLFAYYKAYFTLFGITRSTNFNNTACYKCIKYLSDNTSNSRLPNSLFTAFLLELSDTWYILPLDYFSMGDTNTQRSSSDVGISLNLGTTGQQASTIYANSNPAYGTSFNANVNEGILKLLRFVNRNSVIGKKVSDILKARFGISDDHNKEHEECYFIGSCKTDINVSDVISTAETKDGSSGDVLGSYAGRGIGYGENQSFYLDTKDKVFGCLITLTTIVPDRNGYFQGCLKENSHKERFDFFNPEFDALGYQAVNYSELYSPELNLIGDISDSVFNYVPRYSHYKVAKNIVNGDLSRHQTSYAMMPYVLDRYFRALPSNDVKNFRTLGKYDQYGDYNRIFNYQNSDYDHFIIHTIFDVKVTSPLKSLSTSFDTIDDDVKHIREFEKS